MGAISGVTNACPGRVFDFSDCAAGIGADVGAGIGAGGVTSFGGEFSLNRPRCRE